VRPTLAVVAAIAGAALAAEIMAEYEFTGWTPWAAGLAVGVLVGELVATVGRWHGPVPMAVSGAIAAACLLWGEWLESDKGLEPWSNVAFGAAALAAAVAVWNTRPLPVRPSTTESS
jgi:hypothetical protein